MLCVASFYSHIGAVRFSRDLKGRGIECTLKPVPRSISSSCGTCAQFESDEPLACISGDVDGIYALENGSYTSLWQREED